MASIDTLEHLLSMVLLLAEKDGADRIAFGPISREDLKVSEAWMRCRIKNKWQEMPSPPNHLVEPLVTLIRSKVDTESSGVLHSSTYSKWQIETPGHRSRLVLIRV